MKKIFLFIVFAVFIHSHALAQENAKNQVPETGLSKVSRLVDFNFNSSPIIMAVTEYAIPISWLILPLIIAIVIFMLITETAIRISLEIVHFTSSFDKK